MPTVVVRLYEPISLLFPKGAPMPMSDATVPSPVCILCDGPASPPARMGVLMAPERTAVFVVCGACSNCENEDLERKIIDKVSARPVAASPSMEEVIVVPTRQGKMAARAAQEWTTPLMAPRRAS
jgi:hypothetical protein